MASFRGWLRLEGISGDLVVQILELSADGDSAASLCNLLQACDHPNSLKKTQTEQTPNSKTTTNKNNRTTSQQTQPLLKLIIFITMFKWDFQ